ncbi:Lactonase, 7-bladed beta-propeller-domain-containing protein [Cladochytrium replicatum]|nr:Lactonase, 7-bladed beta-propeller-domain-containing protein [Cladochytrium replicatum]
MTVAANTGNLFVLVGVWGSGIHIYRFTPTAQPYLSFVKTVETPNPTYLQLVSRDGKRHIVVCNELDAGRLTSFALNSSNDSIALSEVNTVPVLGTHPCHISFHPHGQKYVGSAVYNGNNIVLYGFDPSSGRLIASKGTESDPKPKVFEKYPADDAGPQKPRQDASHPHQFNWSPPRDGEEAGGEFAYVVDLGCDAIRVYKFHPEAEKDSELLESVSIVKADPGAGPRHLAFNPIHKDIVYNVNELSLTVQTFKLSPSRDRFEKVGDAVPIFDSAVEKKPAAGSKSEITASGIEVSKDGKFLFISQRGSDFVNVYRLDKDSGSILDLADRYFLAGHTPRHFTIFEDLLLVGLQDSHAIEVVKIDWDTGKLSQVEVVRGIPDLPQYIMVLEA